MRSRPLAVTLVAALALATVLAGPAPGVTVQTRTLPDTMQPLSDACFTGTADGSVAIVTTPVDTETATGTGSLQLRQGDPDDVVGITRPFDLLSAFHGVSARVWDADDYGTAWYDASTWVDIVVVRAGITYHLLKPWKRDVTTPWYYTGALPQSQYHVRREDDGGWVPLASGDTTTVPDFVAQYGDGPGELRILRAPCFAAYAAGNPVGWEPPPGLGTDTYLDLVHMRFDGADDDTYDFEDHLVHLSMRVGQTLITAGDKVTISGGVTRDGARYGGLQVDLQNDNVWNWRTVGTTTSNAKGTVSLNVKPKHNTNYRWSYHDGYVWSPSLQVKVRTRLGIDIRDSTLRRGQTLVVTGSVLPINYSYTPISLMRRTASGPVMLGKGTDNGTGFYRIEVTMKDPGTYRLFVRMPAVSSQRFGDTELGTSVTKKVTVK